MHYKLLIYTHTPVNNLFGYLYSNGFTVEVANSENVLEKLQEKSFDACILDGFGSIDTRYDLIKNVRATSPNVAVLFLTKDIVPEDAINCFNAGADDYMHTPFDIRELVCRLNAVLKRSGKSSYGDEHKIGKYTFSPKERLLILDGKETKLTDREARLLRLLSEYRNSILPRNVALKSIWLDDNVFNGRSMDVYVTKLRKYLSEDPAITITSVRSQGFALVIE